MKNRLNLIDTNVSLAMRTILLKALRNVIGSANLTVYHGTDKVIDRFKVGFKTYRYLLFKSFEQTSQGMESLSMKYR